MCLSIFVCFQHRRKCFYLKQNHRRILFTNMNIYSFCILEVTYFNIIKLNGWSKSNVTECMDLLMFSSALYYKKMSN